MKRIELWMTACKPTRDKSYPPSSQIREQTPFSQSRYEHAEQREQLELEEQAVNASRALAECPLH